MQRAAHATLACALASGTVALATENGGTSRPPGVDTVRVGVMPPPGTMAALTTVSHYSADSFVDGSGNPRAGIFKMDLDFSAVATRLQYTWPELQLMGANVETRAGMALYARGSLALGVQTPAGAMHSDFESSGVGDMFVGPLMLGWRTGNFHHIAGMLVFVPTGKFDRAIPPSVGRNYWAASPAWFFTWFPGDEWELSGSLFYNVNRENPDTGYRSGREASYDWGIGYTPSRGWQFGANGFFYRQVSNDEQAGQVVGDGNRGKAIGIGPFLRFFGDGWGTTFKWQRETEVANRAKGDRFYLQVFMRL